MLRSAPQIRENNPETRRSTQNPSYSYFVVLSATLHAELLP